MSGLLAGKVWQSDLASHLKPLAAVLADIANDDGTSIYPSVAYMAWLLGKGRRSVQTGLSELKALGIIEALRNEKGGKGHTTEYKMTEENFPKRGKWAKGAEVAPLEPKGAVCDTKGRSFEHQRAHSTTQRVQPTAPDPLVEPLVQPLGDPLPFSSPEFLDAWADYAQARKEKRTAVTPTILRALCKKMTDWGEMRSVTALIHSTGYTGLFEPAQGNGNGHQVSSKASRTQDAFARARMERAG